MNKVMLVIDDMKYILLILQTFFLKAGYKVLTATDSQTASELISTVKIDIIICDLHLGEESKENGEEFIQKIRENFDGLIIAITGFELKSKTIKGADKIFLKPFDAKDLKKYIDEVSDGFSN